MSQSKNLPVNQFIKELEYLQSNRITHFTDISKGVRIIKIYSGGKLTEKLIFNL